MVDLSIANCKRLPEGTQTKMGIPGPVFLKKKTDLRKIPREVFWTAKVVLQMWYPPSSHQNGGDHMSYTIQIPVKYHISQYQ